MMDANAVVYWLWLVMVFGVGNARLMELIRNTESVRELYYMLHDPDCGLLSDKDRAKVTKTQLSQAQAVHEYCEKNGIGIMTFEDAAYPDSLRNIYNPPCVLFYRGDVSLLHRGMLLTVVGTRKPSQYSLKVANWLCEDLAKCSIIICSGCAVGLDAASHWAAIRQNQPTVAVLGCGVDYDYPRENRELKERIVQNGLLLSEYFPGAQPLPAHFPVRNRILAGISEAVLVIEAGARSGSLITANFACEQGKSVFCVPPADLFDQRYSGVMTFLRDGAYPVFNHLDVLYAYYLKYPHRITHYEDTDATRAEDSLLFGGKPERAERPRPAKRRTQQAAAVPEETAEPKPFEIPEEAGEEQRRILELLREGAQTVNAICCMLGLSFEETSMLIMEMEMLGWIVNTQRDLYALS